MEENEILDPLNEMHLYVLHCVFLPRINRSCAEFCQQWNNHPLSTEKSRTPLQVWSEGLYLNWNSEIHNTCDLVDDDLTFLVLMTMVQSQIYKQIMMFRFLTVQLNYHLK